MQRFLGGLIVAAAPLGLIIAAYLAANDPSRLPRPVALVAPGIAYIAVGAAALLGLAFHRGRTLYAAIVLLIVFAALQRYLGGGIAGVEARTVYASACILAPALLVALTALEERGASGLHAFLRISMIATACAIPAFVIYTGTEWPMGWAYSRLIDAPLPFRTPVPQVGIVVIAASLIGALALAGTRGTVSAATAAWTIVALAGAVHSVGAPLGVPAYFTASGLILVLAVLTDSYRMAFRDELTGLPSRRALEEALRGVGGKFAIGMVDIDHFKRLNDTHGHDVGDQVLRMVGAKLLDVGGGRAFRYGGEEFAVLFPGKDVESAVPHLEQLRATIAGYRLVIRSPQPERRKHSRTPPDAPARSDAKVETVSVTISAGVAERSAEHPEAKAVIKAADELLYRAKREGRNRVCS
jgi:diguanylate cyclase (GGDEF)-like protein